MLKGIMAGSTVIISDSGKPIVENAQPPAQNGYKTVSQWVDAGTRIIREWHYEPLAGSAQDAAVALARIEASKLPDATALKVKALYPQWDGESHSYTAGDRVLYNGTLYKVVEAHTSQADWTPDKAPSLFAQVLPGQDGTVGEWKQPDSTNPYMKGDRVTYKGHTYESTADNNVWAPDATGAPWKQVK